jgi:hypothetical protein
VQRVIISNYDEYGNAVPTAVSEGTLVEQKTQADATTGTVTFSKPISIFEIYNTDGTNQGVFTVNGINITVPAGKNFKATIGGTQSNSVSITGATSYILSRYE